ncbi:MAG: hypothetical protein IKZ60_05530 [Bacteroidales bacterium]|nr:hypothetical protein [Bacteroidales bacterium]
MDGMLDILQWALPSGAIGSVVTWFFGRTLRRTREAKEIHDTYKQMYEDVSSSLVILQQKYEETNEKLEELTAEHLRTRRALNRLSRAIEAIESCDYSRICPVRSELQVSEECDAGLHGSNGRQPGGKRSSRREHQDRGRNPRNGDRTNPDHAGTKSLPGHQQPLSSLPLKGGGHDSHQPATAGD